MGFDVLGLLIGMLDIRGHIPLSGGFEPDRPAAGSYSRPSLCRRLAAWIATLAGFAVALGGATLLVVKALQ
jgi:hypothetical protein